MNVRSIAGAAFKRTLKGLLGLWCIFGPLIPFAFLAETNPSAAVYFSITLAILIYGLSAWKYRTGSADTIRSILKDAGLTVVFGVLAGAFVGLYGVVSRPFFQISSMQTD